MWLRNDPAALPPDGAAMPRSVVSQAATSHPGRPQSGAAHARAAADPALSGQALIDQWAQVRTRLQAEVGEVEYRSWLRQMALGALDGDEVTLLLPTRFLRDWVRNQYGEKILALWQAQNPSVRRVDIRVGMGREGLAESLSAAPRTPSLSHAQAGSPQAVHTQSAPAAEAQHIAMPSTPQRPAPRGTEEMSAALDPRFTFDSFVVGKPNEFAYACARRVAEHPASQGFNPLFLYGGVGLGKTHLMHAIGLELGRGQAQHSTVAYMSAEKFMYRFIAAIRSQQTLEFKDQLRSVDVLMIDDLQFLIGKDNTQEEFFHTFNALVDAGKQIVVSADKSPSDLSGLEDRLRTRLGCGMVADLHATTFELRFSILQAKAMRAGAAVPAKVIEFLAHKITSNVRELEGSLNRLIAHAALFARPITLETTQEVLHDILKAHDRRVTIDEIQRRVAEHYNLRVTDMSSARRARAVARPRQVAMYLAKQLTARSLPEIGKKFGNRDHTTVIHACARIAELMEKDGGFAEEVDLLKKMLES